MPVPSMVLVQLVRMYTCHMIHNCEEDRWKSRTPRYLNPKSIVSLGRVAMFACEAQKNFSSFLLHIGNMSCIVIGKGKNPEGPYIQLLGN